MPYVYEISSDSTGRMMAKLNEKGEPEMFQVRNETRNLFKVHEVSPTVWATPRVPFGAVHKTANTVPVVQSSRNIIFKRSELIDIEIESYANTPQDSPKNKVNDEDIKDRFGTSSTPMPDVKEEDTKSENESESKLCCLVM